MCCCCGASEGCCCCCGWLRLETWSVERSCYLSTCVTPPLSCAMIDQRTDKKEREASFRRRTCVRTSRGRRGFWDVFGTRDNGIWLHRGALSDDDKGGVVGVVGHTGFGYESFKWRWMAMACCCCCVVVVVAAAAKAVVTAGGKISSHQQ